MVLKSSWIAVFYDDDRDKGWHTYFNRKGFGHVLMLSPRLGHWIVIDITKAGIRTDLVTDKKIKILFRYLTMQKAIAVQAPEATTDYCVVGRLTCAAIASRIFGIKPVCIRPYRLFCALRKNGATPFSLKEN
mgnify:CR=1 FL=1|tara:strand:- start:12302 stop:12697 length:396 start_codon:yes stop_codon:yes gene_type:complete